MPVSPASMVSGFPGMEVAQVVAALDEVCGADCRFNTLCFLRNHFTFSIMVWRSQEGVVVVVSLADITWMCSFSTLNLLFY